MLRNGCYDIDELISYATSIICGFLINDEKLIERFKDNIKLKVIKDFTLEFEKDENNSN